MLSPLGSDASTIAMVIGKILLQIRDQSLNIMREGGGGEMGGERTNDILKQCISGVLLHG